MERADGGRAIEMGRRRAGVIARSSRSIAPRSLIATYLAVAFLFAWAFWLVAWLIVNRVVSGAPLVPVLIVGSFGPLLSAGICTFVEGGAAGTLRFFACGLDPRMGWTVFALAFFLIPILALAAEAIHAGSTHTPFAFEMSWSELPTTYLWLLVLGGALAEEFGWSYLSDKLDLVLPLTPATLALGVIWALWHLPLFVITAPGMIQFYTPFQLFLACVVATRFLFAWAYHRSGGNILSNIIFHNASNLAYSVVAIAPTATEPDVGKLLSFTAMIAICASALWLGWPARRRSRTPA